MHLPDMDHVLSSLCEPERMTISDAFGESAPYEIHCDVEDFVVCTSFLGGSRRKRKTAS